MLSRGAQFSGAITPQPDRRVLAALYQVAAREMMSFQFCKFCAIEAGRHRLTPSWANITNRGQAGVAAWAAEFSSRLRYHDSMTLI
jgi:hypothetical protein